MGNHDNEFRDAPLGGFVHPTKTMIEDAGPPTAHVQNWLAKNIAPIPTLNVSEIFYSLQGEGARAGEASIFIRLSGCSAKHVCYKSGVLCDTEFESGEEMALDELLNLIEPQTVSGKLTSQKCEWIVWTGGEPLDQLTPEIVKYFTSRGYKQAIETSGIKKFDWNFRILFNHISLSPKVAEHVLLKHFDEGQLKGVAFNDEVHVHELRYVRHAGQPGVPQPSLKASYYYLSPHSDGAEINQTNLQHCIRLCLENPQWRLSVQQHKLWKVL